MFWLVLDGERAAIRTRLSDGEKEADRPLQHLIAQQMKLSAAEFRDFVSCRLGADDHARLASQRSMSR
jgi:hypothetical protein